jgi:hypothetical protein
LVEGLAEISLARGVVFIALLSGSGELYWVEIGSTYGAVFDFSDTVLLGVGNCLVFLLGSFAELFNSSVVI